MTQLGIQSVLFSHPEDTSEGSAKLVICEDSSLSLRMAPTHFEFLNCEAK